MNEAEQCRAKDADMALELRIERDFKYHSPNPESVPKFTEIRSHAKHLAHVMRLKVPVSRELSTALTKLEEAVMWANAGIARNQDAET